MKPELFKKDSCPYCQTVMSYIVSSGRKDVIFFDIIESEEAAGRLVEVGGKRQVSRLFIDGDPLYESLDMIDWLKKHPEV